MIVKVVFNFILLAGLARGGEQNEIQRLAALADYVAADYPGAVQKGQVVAQSEYDEQRGLIAEARLLAAKLPSHAALDADLQKLAADVEARAADAAVAADCRVLHRRLIT